MWKCREFWLIFILGLYLVPQQGQCRALTNIFQVNITNTWTLPQDGFTVFYRFFRDKISWFEADAVCQFHHANLVTVDNGVQFDATRAFLRELDVTDSVWIGLMRPQNSEHFTWSNSKPLESTSGYWAETLPLMESPICAVIDPIRDYRWHALRCGGPETASFLCEMNVPEWASECTLRGIPNLTIQYMADTGSVELSKDCGDEGLIQRVCRGREDRDQFVKELVCKNEKNPVIEENSITPTDLSQTYQKSIQIISKISSDNNEDNNINSKLTEKKISKQPEQNPVQKLIEQFNVEELMQADQPQNHDDASKPEKKVNKKNKSLEKKEKPTKKAKKQIKVKVPSNEEIMLSDQPFGGPNGLEEPLPHIKKSLAEDLKEHETTTVFTSGITTNVQEQEGSTAPSEGTSHINPESTTFVTVTDTTAANVGATMALVSSASETKETESLHPMHPQVAHAPAVTTSDDVVRTTHTKETNDDHFIPPMLLVKSHYTSTKSHIEDQGLPSTSEKVEITTQKFSDTTMKIMESTSDVVPVITTIKSLDSTINISVPTEGAHIDTTQKPTSQTASEAASTEHQVVEIKIGNPANPTTFSITTRGFSSEPVTNPSPVTTTEYPQTNDQPPSTTTQRPVTSDHHISSTPDPLESKRYHTKEKNKFSNEENFQPYKPNRRRSLTKPETTTYLKKILG